MRIDELADFEGQDAEERGLGLGLGLACVDILEVPALVLPEDQRGHREASVNSQPELKLESRQSMGLIDEEIQEVQTNVTACSESLINNDQANDF